MISAREGSPAWVLDVAHNPDAARVLARNLDANPHLRQDSGGVRNSGGQGCGGDRLLARPCIDAWWCASVDGTRGRSGQALAVVVQEEVQGPVLAADSVASACAAACSCGGAAGSNRRIRILSHRRAGDRLARIPRIAAAGGASRIYFAVMDRRVKERLIGASILVALVVLVVPELLSGPKPKAAPAPTLPAAAPEPIRNVTVDLTTSKAPVELGSGAGAAAYGFRCLIGREFGRRADPRCADPLRAARRGADFRGDRLPLPRVLHPRRGRRPRFPRLLNLPRLPPHPVGMVPGLCSSAASPAARTPIT